MENLKASLYADLKAAGCEMDSHESDLYVAVTPESRRIMARHPLQASQATTFVDQVSGAITWDVPFAFDPFWTGKANSRAVQS